VGTQGFNQHGTMHSVYHFTVLLCYTNNCIFNQLIFITLQLNQAGLYQSLLVLFMIIKTNFGCIYNYMRVISLLHLESPLNLNTMKKNHLMKTICVFNICMCSLHSYFTVFKLWIQLLLFLMCIYAYGVLTYMLAIYNNGCCFLQIHCLCICCCIQVADACIQLLADLLNTFMLYNIDFHTPLYSC